MPTPSRERSRGSGADRHWSPDRCLRRCSAGSTARHAAVVPARADRFPSSSWPLGMPKSHTGSKPGRHRVTHARIAFLLRLRQGLYSLCNLLLIRYLLQLDATYPVHGLGIPPFVPCRDDELNPIRVVISAKPPRSRPRGIPEPPPPLTTTGPSQGRPSVAAEGLPNFRRERKAPHAAPPRAKASDDGVPTLPMALRGRLVTVQNNLNMAPGSPSPGGRGSVLRERA